MYLKQRSLSIPSRGGGGGWVLQFRLGPRTPSQSACSIRNFFFSCYFHFSYPRRWPPSLPRQPRQPSLRSSSPTSTSIPTTIPPKSRSSTRLRPPTGLRSSHNPTPPPSLRTSPPSSSTASTARSCPQRPTPITSPSPRRRSSTSSRRSANPSPASPSTSPSATTTDRKSTRLNSSH